MTKIDETLKKIAATTSKTGSQNTKAVDRPKHDLPGDPNCPHCGGVGYLHVDLPITDPEFGKLQLCDCRKKAVIQSVYDRLYALSNLGQLSDLRFETFKIGSQVGLSPAQTRSQETAYNSARQFAGNLNGWLLLMGEYGTGKTHLAAAIANEAVSLGVPTIFLTVPDLLDWLRFSFNDEEMGFESRFEEIRNIRLLIMDDLGTQNATPWAQEKLFQIINYRYINHLPMVITSNVPLDEIDGRIRSRLQDPQLVSMIRIIAPDYRRPASDTGHPELSSLELHAGQTFGNFSIRRGEGMTAEAVKSLEAAFHASQAFAEKPQGWLVLVGDYGCGKTHLAAAIGNYRAGIDIPPLFVVVSDLLDHLRATFSPASAVGFDRRFEEVRTASLLILDDLGTQAATPWAREKLYQLLNHRYNAQLPTVITTSQDVDELDARIRTRVMDNRICKVVAILAPSYRDMAKQAQHPRPKLK